MKERSLTREVWRFLRRAEVQTK